MVIQTVTNNFQNYCNIVKKTKKLVSAGKNVDKVQSLIYGITVTNLSNNSKY